MTTSSDPHQDSFKLSHLIYDSRYRSMTIQAVALAAFVLALGWLVNNAVVNLAAAGKDFNFSFLSVRAGYDINQRLIEYSSDSDHLRAAYVGLLNTLLVAFLGCILATIVGVLAGVLRLSHNWVTAKIMAVYVESFRNIPVLLWIIAFFAVLTEATSAPKLFRGENPAASMLFNDSVAITNRGTYIPSPVWGDGSGFVIAAFILSVIAAIFVARYSQKRFELTGQGLPMFRINLAILIVPVVLVYFVMGSPVSLDYPALKGFNFRGGLHVRNSLIALWLALSFYTGAFIAENVRAGILAISKGQTEAPQALRVIIPPMISNYLNLTKNTSLAIAVGYMDLRATLGGITLNQTGRELEAMMLMMLIYLLISLAISTGMNFYNKSVMLKER